jgi:hypothetical protein
MGVVYKARQVALGRLAALKVLLTGAHASRESLVRFEIEARAVAELKHPNIVQVYGFGESDGKPFLALEYLDGGSLRRFEGVPQEAKTVAGVVEALSRAVQHAHDKQIVHRDLKPANVLLAGEPEAPLGECVPRIADFGLAKRIGGDDIGHTATHAILGTPAYMAPEQARGTTREVGPPADIYGLGAILYQLLTGLPPIRGSSVQELLLLVQMADPLPPRQLLPTVPLDLQTICLKCLQKEPGRRYATAGELADDLGRYLSGEPIRARPTPAWERAWKWARRRPTIATLAGAVLAATVLLVVLSWVFVAIVVEKNLVLDRTNKELDLRNDELEQRTGELDRTNGVLAQKNWQLIKTTNDLEDALKTAKTEKENASKAEKLAVHESVRSQNVANVMLLMVNETRARYGELPPASRALLNLALETAEGVTEQKGDTPEARLYNAHKHRLVADWADLLGDPERAEMNYRSALKEYGALPARVVVAGREFNPRFERIETLIGLCKVLQRPAGTDILDELTQALRELGDPSLDDPRKTVLQGRVYTVRANLHARVPSESEQARADYQEALRLLRSFRTTEKPGTANDREGAILALAQAELNYGTFLAFSPLQADHARSRSYLEAAIDRLDGLVKQNPQETVPARERARATANLAAVLGLLARDADQEKDPDRGDRLRGQAQKKHAEGVGMALKLYRDHQELPDYGCLRVTTLIGQAQHEVLLAQAGENPLFGGRRQALARARDLLEQACTLARNLHERNRSVRAYAEARARACHTLGVVLLFEYQRLPERYRGEQQWRDVKENLEEAWSELKTLLGKASDDPRLQQELDEVRGNLILCYHLLIHQTALPGSQPVGRANHDQIRDEMEPHVRRLVELYRERAEARPRNQTLSSGAGTVSVFGSPAGVAELWVMGAQAQPTTPWNLALVLTAGEQRSTASAFGTPARVADLWVTGFPAQATTPWALAARSSLFGFDADLASTLVLHAHLLAGQKRYRDAERLVTEAYQWAPPEWDRDPVAVAVLARCLALAAQAAPSRERQEEVRSDCERVLKMLRERSGPAWYRPDAQRSLAQVAQQLDQQVAATTSAELGQKLREVAQALRYR